MSLKVFVIAGEASGDKLGASCMDALKTLCDVEFRGVGGAMMTEAGLVSQFPMSELSLMGIMEILPKYFHLKRRIREVAEAILDWQPDVVLTIDSPDFCLRVADIVKARSDIRVCHYVAPTVWAWRPERAAKMAARVDQVLALFPFEPPYFEREGLRCDFVGHPVVTDEIATEAEVTAFRETNQIGDAPLILVLPGSRKGEVTRLSETFGATLALFAQTHPTARVVLPMAQGVEDLVREMTSHWAVAPILIEASDRAGKRAAFKAADMALAASGTVSLELAANDTPMVIAYKMNWLTQKIVERKLLIDTVTLVNLVSETRVVPEFLAQNCVPEKIAPALSVILLHPEAQSDALSMTMDRLGRGGDAPGLRAARAILDGIAG
ncbi:MAG: lipid-A-disaccharide synthase [Alphaproteobacteria bacterium]|nr:lipid-A-disaccharide synthase [Alphaproteobacteria bacterium]MBU1279627.1 lipid-A-disaccharide synthase [Alphaproteobacteria bacterium]MBU1827559.1 lipid-A-disaccharide synthase [Alphaproteobacteria bacterium]MBU2078324.1 lipid-A-disaccharide synthase [Alphaproteobacteria bacterium]MBU2159570.1 lipid-A-disaccharide synthase [Alphaproteobacteria bacterium]